MRLGLFSCNHLVPERIVPTPLVQTLVTGQRPPPGSPVQTDLDGRNISARGNFSELRQQCFIWQNRLSEFDYVGFEHYRRPFFLDALPAGRLRAEFPEMYRIRRMIASNSWATDIHVGARVFGEFADMRAAFAAAEIDAVNRFVGDHDIIFTYPLFEPAYKNFRVNNKDADHLWHAFVDAARTVWSRNFGVPYVDPPAAWSGYRNMYILRAELFDEYMDILFTILLPLDTRHPDAPARIWGYLAELTFGAFIIQKTMENAQLRTKALPYLFFDGSA